MWTRVSTAAGDYPAVSLTPGSTTLTSGPSLVIDAALGDSFFCDLTEATQIENPLNPEDGQRLALWLHSTTAHALTFGTEFDGDLPAQTSDEDSVQLYLFDYSVTP